MQNTLSELLEKIQQMENELEREIDQKRKEFRYRLKEKRIEFEAGVRHAHRELREGLLSYLIDARPLFLLSAPVIYSLILPVALLDLVVTVFQRICFPIYGIPVVPRADFVVIDRHHLAYLNAIERFNCAYCGYANGVIAYAREVAGRTEAYWCPIKHTRKPWAPHRGYYEFLDYGDGKAYRNTLDTTRAKLVAEKKKPDGL